MSTSYDELMARVNELGEDVEIPQELLDSIAGGLDNDDKNLMKFMAFCYKHNGLTVDEAVARDRANWHRGQEELDYMREIWDTIKS